MKHSDADDLKAVYFSLTNEMCCEARHVKNPSVFM